LRAGSENLKGWEGVAGSAERNQREDPFTAVRCWLGTMGTCPGNFPSPLGGRGGKSCGICGKIQKRKRRQVAILKSLSRPDRPGNPVRRAGWTRAGKVGNQKEKEGENRKTFDSVSRPPPGGGEEDLPESPEATKRGAHEGHPARTRWVSHQTKATRKQVIPGNTSACLLGTDEGIMIFWEGGGGV